MPLHNELLLEGIINIGKTKCLIFRIGNLEGYLQAFVNRIVFEYNKNKFMSPIRPRPCKRSGILPVKS